MSRLKTPPPSEQALPCGLSAADVCAILKSCRQNQVVRLRLGDLEVELRASDVESGQVSAAKAPKWSEETVQHAEREQVVLSKEDQLDLLAVEDPVAYEKFVLSEDAERRPSEDDDL